MASALSRWLFCHIYFEGSPAHGQGDRWNDPSRLHLPALDVVVQGEKDGASWRGREREEIGGVSSLRLQCSFRALNVSKWAESEWGSPALTAGLCGLALLLPGD